MTCFQVDCLESDCWIEKKQHIEESKKGSQTVRDRGGESNYFDLTAPTLLPPVADLAPVSTQYDLQTLPISVSVTY